MIPDIILTSNYVPSELLMKRKDKFAKKIYG